MMHRKVRPIRSKRFTALLALLLFVAGCSSSGTATSTTAKSTTTTSSSTTTTVAPTTTTASAPVPTTAPAPSPAPAGLTGKIWTRLPTSSKVVALTFDAGANGDGVPSILHTLAAEGTPGSFFLTGHFCSMFPDLVHQIAAAGYRIGNHSTTHPYFTHIDNGAIDNEVIGAANTIQGASGQNPSPFFRFPYGDADARTLAEVNRLGYAGIGWTVDTAGWMGTSGGASLSSVIGRAMGGLQPGEIVLMHVGSHPTDHSTLDADALPEIIHQMKAAGYSFVSITALQTGI